ncbi:hypothetical protein MBLNU459_g0107t2 [Dothideomycetes sp. NU459]
MAPSSKKPKSAVSAKSNRPKSTKTKHTESTLRLATRKGRAIRPPQRFGFDSPSSRSVLDIALKSPNKQEQDETSDCAGLCKHWVENTTYDIGNPFYLVPARPKDLLKPSDVFPPQPITSPSWLKAVLHDGRTVKLDGRNIPYSWSKTFDKNFRAGQIAGTIPPSLGSLRSVVLDDLVEEWTRAKRPEPEWYTELVKKVPRSAYASEKEYDDALEAAFMKGKGKEYPLIGLGADGLLQKPHHSMTRIQWQCWIDLHFSDEPLLPKMRLGKPQSGSFSRGLTSRKRACPKYPEDAPLKPSEVFEPELSIVFSSDSPSPDWLKHLLDPSMNPIKNVHGKRPDPKAMLRFYNEFDKRFKEFQEKQPKFGSLGPAWYEMQALVEEHHAKGLEPPWLDHLNDMVPRSEYDKDDAEDQYHYEKRFEAAFRITQTKGIIPKEDNANSTYSWSMTPDGWQEWINEHMRACDVPSMPRMRLHRGGAHDEYTFARVNSIEGCTVPYVPTINPSTVFAPHFSDPKRPCLVVPSWLEWLEREVGPAADKTSIYDKAAWRKFCTLFDETFRRGQSVDEIIPQSEGRGRATLEELKKPYEGCPPPRWLQRLNEELELLRAPLSSSGKTGSIGESIDPAIAREHRFRRGQDEGWIPMTTGIVRTARRMHPSHSMQPSEWQRWIDRNVIGTRDGQIVRAGEGYLINTMVPRNAPF